MIASIELVDGILRALESGRRCQHRIGHDDCEG
jgi:hypothetical protein